jgi:hypothetical protein
MKNFTKVLAPFYLFIYLFIYLILFELRAFMHAKQALYIFSQLPVHFALVILEMRALRTICPE